MPLTNGKGWLAIDDPAGDPKRQASSASCDNHAVLVLERRSNALGRGRILTLFVGLIFAALRSN